MALDHKLSGSGQEAPGAPGAQDDLLDLLRQLTRQGAHLASQQLSLLQAEVREAGNDLKASIGALLGAAVVGIAGLGVLLMGVSFLLGNAIEDLGLATVIVGAASLAIALILYSAARKKMSQSNLSPERSIRTLERTPDTIRGELSTEN